MKRNSLRKRQIEAALLAILLAAGGCSASDDETDEDESMEVPEQSVVSKEVEASSDDAKLDPEELKDGTYKSPMTELESVDDVALSEEARRQAEEAAADSEHYVKEPSKPAPDK